MGIHSRARPTIASLLVSFKNVDKKSKFTKFEADFIFRSYLKIP